MATPVKYARDVLNGWGVNNGSSSSQAANALKYIQSRWCRMQFDGDITSSVQGLQNQLVSVGAPNPNLMCNLLLNGYVQNAATNSWNNQQNWILSIANITGPNGTKVLKAIEGPNEMNSTYTGNGCRAPNGTTLIGNNDLSGNDHAANANMVDWASTVKSFKNSHTTQLSGVELCSGTILNFAAANWPTEMNISAYCDYGTFHYYAGINGTNGVPSYPPNPDNFAHFYDFAKAGLGTASLIHTEGGASSQTGGGYGQDGRSMARYMLMQILDHHAKGGHRFLIYNLANNPGSYPGNITSYNEDNFGLFYGDWTPKPCATVLHNLQNLLALNNDYSNSSNWPDTATFTPAYTGQGFSVTGLQNEGSAGSSLIMPKSDGSTMIAVWNEPLIDTGSGTSSTVSANSVTVNFGSTQSYKVWDITGGGNVSNFTASLTPTAFATGTGSSVTFNLFGTPVLIELSGAPAPTQVPGAVTPAVTTTATEANLTWSAATNQPNDYIITVTELT